MSKKNYRISPEIKGQILKRIKEDGVPISQLAEEHGICTNTIYSWLSKGVKAGPSFREFSKLQKENKELFALVGELTVKLSQSQKKN